MQTFQAGYVLDSLFSLFKDDLPKQELANHLKPLCNFSLKTESNLQTGYNPDPIICVLNNILQRGIPTMSSVWLEDQIITHYSGIRKENNASGELQYSHHTVNHEFKKQVFEALKYRDKNENWHTPAVGFIAVPMAIARIHKVLTEYIAAGVLRMNDNLWEIAIIEWDLACGVMALQDFEYWLAQLGILEGNARTFPPIQLSVYATESVLTSELNKNQPVEPIRQFDANKEFDLLIDVSMSGEHEESFIQTRAKHIAQIRTAKQADEKRIFSQSIIQYRNVTETDEQSMQALRYISQSILRKALPTHALRRMASRLLQAQDVCGVTPSIDEPTMVYQLLSLLQPGISLVVLPEEHDSTYHEKQLKINLIDTYATLTHFDEDDLKRLLNANVSLAFCTINQVHKPFKLFGGLLQAMHQRGTYFTYVVLLNAQSVSQWSSDFNPLYLRTASKLIEYCKPKVSLKPMFFALTPAAPLLAIEDIRRDFFIEEEDVVQDMTPIEKIPLTIKKFEPANCSLYPDYIQMPFSAESLVKEALYKYTYNAQRTTVLLDAQPTEFETDEDEIISGEIRITPQTHKGIKASEYGYKKLKQKMPGRKKEFGAIKDLLLTINYIPLTKKQVVESLVGEKYIMLLNLSVSPAEDPTTLTINCHNQIIGSIDYQNLKSEIHPDYANKELAKGILNETISVIEKHCPKKSTPSELFDWLKSGTTPKPIDGIEKLLTKMQVGESTKITIGFQNNTLHKIAFLLIKHVSELFTLDNVQKGYHDSYDASSFIQKLSETADVDVEIQGLSVKKEIEEAYYSIRTRYASFLALYRLQTLGVVQDIAVNEYTQTFEVMILRRKIDYYFEKLNAHLSLYYTQDKLDILKDSVNFYPGTGIVERYSNCLIDFVYNKIWPQHIENSTHIEDIAKNSLENTDMESGQELRNFLRYYFDAKYALKAHSPNLITDTHELSTASWGLVEKYIDEAFKQPDNMAHLRWSCGKLLRIAPENFTLLMLQGFSILAITRGKGKQQTQDEAMEYLAHGFDIFKESGDPDAVDWVEKISYLVKKADVDQKTQLAIYQVLDVKLHKKWLLRFKTHFLDGYAA